jgi:hypothetical protein
LLYFFSRKPANTQKTRLKIDFVHDFEKAMVYEIYEEQLILPSLPLILNRTYKLCVNLKKFQECWYIKYIILASRLNRTYFLEV